MCREPGEGRYERVNRRNLVEISVPAFICIAVVYGGLLLVTVWTLADRFPRRKVMVQSTQAEERQLALLEGQTIVGVTDTVQAVCFFIGSVLRLSLPPEN